MKNLNKFSFFYGGILIWENKVAVSKWLDYMTCNYKVVGSIPAKYQLFHNDLIRCCRLVTDSQFCMDLCSSANVCMREFGCRHLGAYIPLWELCRVPLTGRSRKQTRRKKLD